MDQTYAGVCSYSSMRFLMSYACQQGMILAQTDITGAYLESYLDEVIYMDPPPDMYSADGKPPTDANGDEVVLLVKRGLYGLQQSGYAWAQCFKEFLLRDKDYNMGFDELTGEHNMYRKVFTRNAQRADINDGPYDIPTSCTSRPTSCLSVHLLITTAYL